MTLALSVTVFFALLAPSLLLASCLSQLRALRGKGGRPQDDIVQFHELASLDLRGAPRQPLSTPLKGRR